MEFANNDDDDMDEDIDSYKLRCIHSSEIDVQKEMDHTVFDDMVTAFTNSKLLAPLVALMGMLLAYHITIAPYQSSSDSISFSSKMISVDELARIRPVLNNSELLSIQYLTLHAETELTLPPPIYNQIKFRFYSSINPNIEYGNRRLPDMFYEGVTFGITSENSHDLKYTGNNINSLAALKQDLADMFPKPTAILDRTTAYNTTGWHEAGFGVYFSYDDLQRQGKLSNDHRKEGKWARVSEDIMWIARKYRQVYITVWYPHKFGQISASEIEKKTDQYRYHTIIQQTLPTRTGLFELQSTGVVWLSAVNRSADIGPPPKVIQREWSADDDWKVNRN